MAELKVSQLTANNNPPLTSEFLIANAGSSEKTTLADISNVTFATSLNGVIGNIMTPLVHIPFKRENDEVSLSGQQTFTRATPGTYFDSTTGSIGTAPIDTPRFEKMADGQTGVLIEGASTNMLLYSDVLENAVWIANGSTVTPDVMLAPDGTTTADMLVESATTAEHQQYQTYSGVATIGDVLTGSVFAKQGSRTKLRVYLSNSTTMFTGGTTPYADFDLYSGTVISHSASVASATITPLANGWYRCEATTTAAIATGTTIFYSSILDNAGANTYTGDGTSGLYLWGAQVEKLAFASSYIATQGVAVTRPADNLTFPVSGNRYKASDDMTIAIDFDWRNDGGTRTVLNFGTTENYLLMRGNNGQIYNGTPTYLLRGAMPQQAVNRWVYRHTSGVMESFVDGVNDGIASNSTAVQGSSVNGTIRVGGWFSGDLFGHVRNLRIYDHALTDSEITAL